MARNSISKDELIVQLMAERDALFRENSRLREAQKTDPCEPRTDFDRMLADKDAIIEKKDIRISQLEKHIHYLQRQMWGGKSERFIKPDSEERWLDFEGFDMLPGEIEAAKEAEKDIKKEKEARKKRMEKSTNRPVRKRLPDNLKRVVKDIYPEGYNEEDWVLLDESTPLYTEELIKVPAEFYVLRTVRHKAMRKSDHKIVTAGCPVKPIAKSEASSSVLADFVIGKYVDHIPIYRQLKQYSRLGITLSESTVLGWIQGISDLLMPLYFRLWELMKLCDYLQSDETTLPIVYIEKHKTVKGYLWIVRDPVCGRQWFFWDKGSRSGKVVLKLFHDYQGALQTDGYERYELLDGKKGVILLGCWAHARRKFEESMNNDKKRAEYALSQIQLIYDVERQAKDQKLSCEETAELRARLAYPILVRFEKWMVREYQNVIEGSPIAEAIKYTYHRFDKLTRYHLDGRYQIDNNGIENAVRPVAIGRKNYLFCQNHDTAESTAIMYTFMGCCKAAGVDFNRWMMFFLDHIHEYDTDYSKDIAQLLPENLKSAGIL